GVECIEAENDQYEPLLLESVVFSPFRPLRISSPDRYAKPRMLQPQRLPNRTLCQDQASLTIVVRSERCADHPNNRLTCPASATRVGGSPARRLASQTSIFIPVTERAVSITSRTDAPRPLARLTAKVFPPSSRYWSARTCARARSDTWT